MLFWMIFLVRSILVHQTPGGWRESDSSSGVGDEFDFDIAILEGMTYELEVRLLSRDERHDGQLWRSSCSVDRCSMIGIVR